MSKRIVPAPSAVLAVLFALTAMASAPALAASEWWVEEAPTLARTQGTEDLALAYRTYRVDAQDFRAQLAAAPESYTGAPGVEFLIPTPDGHAVRVRAIEDPILGPEMAERRPDVRTYSGVGVDDPLLRVRFGITDQGVHARAHSPGGNWTIDNRFDLGPELALAWWDRDRAPSRFTCGVDESFDVEPFEELPPAGLGRRLGEVVRTYRWAMTATGEFTVQAGSVANVESIIVTLTNTMNTLYLNEFSVRFELVGTAIYTDPATDPYPTGNILDSSLLQQSTNALNAVVGSANYDVGHIISVNPGAGAGGLAFVGQQCDFSLKGSGGTLLGSATAGAIYPIMIHEVGHQLGARHSFNSVAGGCNGNRTANSAYEIGSGVTIMSYAGLCGIENVQSDDIDIFNAGSQFEISGRIISRGSCGSVVSSGNSLPVIGSMSSITIPRQTAFELRATVTDANGDPMTFAWEQFDLGVETPPYDPTNGPAFRNFAPQSSSTRSIPLYSAYRRGAQTPWEFLPTVDRTMDFQLVVRDNRPGGGAVVQGSREVVVSGDPFRVLTPNGGESFESGSDIQVTWNPGGTVDTNVRILASTDAGITWSEIVASTPNDGSETVQVPCSLTTEGRIRIEGAVNPWFDLSDQNFTLTAETAPPVLSCPTGFLVTTDDENGVLSTDPAVQALLDVITVTDNCDSELTPTLLLPGTLPIGDTTVGATATDSSGNLGLCTFTVTVELDTSTSTPPFDRSRTGFVSISPNPFNPRTTIEFNLARAQSAQLDVFDVRGRRLVTLTEGSLGAGSHSIVWNGTDADGREVPSGVYYLKLTTDEGAFSERAVLLK